jgi:hypothetical protein
MLPVGQDSDQPTFIASRVGIGGDDPRIGDETAAGSTRLAVDTFLSGDPSRQGGNLDRMSLLGCARADAQARADRNNHPDILFRKGALGCGFAALVTRA